jgi:hypothetical protein
MNEYEAHPFLTVLKPRAAEIGGIVDAEDDDLSFEI